jgi:hypothetical protein
MRCRPSSATSAVSSMVSKHRLASSLDFRLPHTCSVRIDVRSIPRQRLSAQPVVLSGNPVQHAAAAMCGQPIPDQQHRALLLQLMQVAQEFDKGFLVVGARTQLKDEVGITAIGFVHQRAGDGQSLPSEAVAQHGRLASRRPRGSHRWQQ